ncbi:hypothetical protein TSUD_130940 [Trifolium subterraneum]|nr:hypothetical protein TSUD_130940 [Trifolium subterraneum]
MGIYMTSCSHQQDCDDEGFCLLLTIGSKVVLFIDRLFWSSWEAFHVALLCALLVPAIGLIFSKLGMNLVVC